MDSTENSTWVKPVICGLALVAAGGLAFTVWNYFKRKNNTKHIKVLVNAADKSLTPEFKEALTVIFREEDVDGDGVLNDVELDHLLVRVQGKHLDENLKQFISATFDTNSEGHLTLEGWIESYQWMLHNLDDESQAEAAIKRDLKAFDWTYDQFKG